MTDAAISIPILASLSFDETERFYGEALDFP